MTMYPRVVIGTPEPSPLRRRLLKGRKWLLCHEVGVDTGPNGRYTSADPARVLDDAKAAARYGISAGKTYEYNWLIGLDGSIFEQAGDLQAAHCLGFNDQSIGVLLMRALKVPPSAAMIEAWHDLRDMLRSSGALSADYQVAPHYRFRATSCPGLAAEKPGVDWNSPTGEGRTGNLIPELMHRPQRPAPQPETPPTLEEDLVLSVLRINGDTAVFRGWADRAGHFLQIEWVPTIEQLNVLLSEGAVSHTVERHALRAACTLLGPIPPGWSRDEFANVIGG